MAASDSIGASRHLSEINRAIKTNSGWLTATQRQALARENLGSNVVVLQLDIADGSADAAYYLAAPFAGAVTKIETVIDGAVSTADITVTARKGSTGMTGGVVTIATASSAAGDYDSATVTALNTVTAGEVFNLNVAGGGAGGSPRIHVNVHLTRS